MGSKLDIAKDSVRLALQSKTVSGVLLFSLGIAVAVVCIARPALGSFFVNSTTAAWFQAVLSVLAIGYSVALWARERAAQTYDQRRAAQLADFRIAVASRVSMKLLKTILPLIRNRVEIWRDEGLDLGAAEKNLAVPRFEEMSRLYDAVFTGSVTTIKAAAEVVLWSERFKISVKEYISDGIEIIDDDRATALLNALDLLVEPLDVAVEWFDALYKHPPADDSYKLE